MLIVNTSRALTALCSFTGGSIGAGRQAFSNPSQWIARAQAMNNTTSIPSGYRGGVAIALAMSDGGLAATIQGNGSIESANLAGLGVIAAVIPGSGSVSFGNLAGGLNAQAALAGVGTVSAPLVCFGNLTCSISIGARPSATDIAQAVWEELLTGHTAAGSAAKKLKDGLTKSDFIGLS